MAIHRALLQPTKKSIAAHVRKHATTIKKALRHGHMASETVRQAEYKGHHIEVRTIYEIHVDDKPITGHLAVTNDGRVHYHPVPNASFVSAIDLVKRLIDAFPDDFGADAPGGKKQAHDGSHTGSRAKHTPSYHRRLKRRR